MEYAIKQLSKLAGVSVRTLHFYDEIGLLRPVRAGANGYRYYGEAAVLRLQQILFYKELGLSLDETHAPASPVACLRVAGIADGRWAFVAEVLDQPGFDVARAPEAHRRAL